MIIGLSGRAGVGKSAVAECFVARGYVEVASADEIKRIAGRLFGFTDRQLWGKSKHRNESPPDRPDIPSARKVLQHLGTEGVRAIHNTAWIDYALDVAWRLEVGMPKASGSHYYYFAPRGLTVEPGWKRPPRGVVISDVRFADEMTQIARAGGMTFRVVRDVPALADGASQHASEQAQTEIPDEAFNGIIDNNNGTLEELDETVGRLFEDFQL